MQKSNKKKCKRCTAPLTGEMVFHPEICLSCVIDLDSAMWDGDTEAKKELKKYEKK